MLKFKGKKNSNFNYLKSNFPFVYYQNYHYFEALCSFEIKIIEYLKIFFSTRCSNEANSISSGPGFQYL